MSVNNMLHYVPHRYLLWKNEYNIIYIDAAYAKPNKGHFKYFRSNPKMYFKTGRKKMFAFPNRFTFSRRKEKS